MTSVTADFKQNWILYWPNIKILKYYQSISSGLDWSSWLDVSVMRRTSGLYHKILLQLCIPLLFFITILLFDIGMVQLAISLPVFDQILTALKREKTLTINLYISRPLPESQALKGTLWIIDSMCMLSTTFVYVYFQKMG